MFFISYCISLVLACLISNVSYLENLLPTSQFFRLVCVTPCKRVCSGLTLFHLNRRTRCLCHVNEVIDLTLQTQSCRHPLLYKEDSLVLTIVFFPPGSLLCPR
uniref:Secreted protein n=1 Tax=Anguilla anguilla TaxID=7936 RepID=A0A0E9XXV5_ANGAN